MQSTLKIHIIDDDVDDHLLFFLALKRIEKAFICHFSTCGAHALELYSSDHNYIPDYIFIDVNMPIMDGITCLSELRMMSRLKDVPIYMYTTTVEDRVEEICLTKGAFGVLQKMPTIREMAFNLTDIFSKT